MYFRSANGDVKQYEGKQTKEDIIDFIQKNRDKSAQADSAEPESAKSETEYSNSAKDELWRGNLRLLLSFYFWSNA